MAPVIRYAEHSGPKGWVLKARRAITSSATGEVYPVGSIVPYEALGKNFEALLSAKYVMWVPPTEAEKQTPKPVTLPAVAVPQGKPVVQIVADRDPVESYRLTKAALTRVLNGNANLAEDYLMQHPEARELYKLATRLQCQREAKRRNLPSISPDRLEMPL